MAARVRLPLCGRFDAYQSQLDVRHGSDLRVPADLARWIRSDVRTMLHKRVLEWQADHPTITWVFWLVVWLVVAGILLWPRFAA